MKKWRQKLVYWQKKSAPLITTYQTANISKNAVVVAYYALLSVFPLLIFLGNLLPFLNIPVKEVLTYIQALLPASIYQTLASQIKGFLTNGSGGLLSLGAVITLWSASRGIVSLRDSVNQAYGIKTPQNALLARFLSLFLTLFFVLLMIFLVLVFGFGQDVLNYIVPRLELPNAILAIFAQLKLPVTGLMLLIILLLLFYFLPNARLHLRCVLPGTLLTATGWLVLAQFFALYVRYFARSVSSYGAIGTFIVLMFWLVFIAQILLFSAFLNRLIEEHFYGEIQPIAGKLRDWWERWRSKKA
ncbi:YihY/virulence factor BrkB family protein [Loigolactobacillus zhaoyuanensis]|uniref:YihY/virulence factor BrkB family protein n=1 Tax=Loigolactobacillus zhaoyuanensis TaxID=2486017 RepID=A0ABW8UBE9_9LACO|nr:YihY/virulence factor BrkB family protein [Loigolactobacillus zhaoyuanensis]